MEIQELGVRDIKDTLSVRLRKDFFNLLVEIPDTHEISLLKLQKQLTNLQKAYKIIKVIKR